MSREETSVYLTARYLSVNCQLFSGLLTFMHLLRSIFLHLTVMKVLYIVFIFVVLQIGTIAENEMRNTRGECVKIVSYRASQNVPYQETYKQRKWGLFYKTQVRWNYKTEYFTSWRKEYTCCDGYKEVFRFDTLTCEPICRPNCGNGTCIQPNVCVCNYGYAEETDVVSNSVCVPVCSRTCVHGKCTAPEACTCDDGYSLSIDDYTCEPVCTTPCGTGAYCSEPEICACLSGYARNTSTSACVPICTSECVHGECTAPDTCTCFDGFEFDNWFVCKPKCEYGCVFGKCMAPNECICDTGYSLQEQNPGVCEPICSHICVMGTCVAPETCSCFNGYALLENSSYVCEPFCEKTCLNGKCTGPDECTCNVGFQKNWDSWNEVCKPYCDTPCEPFGVCSAPNVCTCIDGYRLVDKNKTTETTMQYATTSVCEPICDSPCVNGFCSTPNWCTCNSGYYLSSFNNSFCEPYCFSECVNGFCSAPNTCTCNKGYHPSYDQHTCVPSCEEDCTNGYCSAPNTCSCDFGYQLQLSASSMNVCEPICHPMCKVHENCVAPDVCVCQNGYRMVHYSDFSISFECEPICSFECGNGTCTAPEVCTCIDGYRNTETGECVPACRSCNNGTCIAPEVCECDEGFSLVSLTDDEISDSHLDEDKSGNRNNGNGSRCMPRCESCDNGECVAPDECQCHVGYVMIEGDICVLACKEDCGTHGKCVEKRRSCECHYGWSTEPHCDQPTLCIVSVKSEENHNESLNIIEKRNATIEYVFLHNPTCPECIDKINNETLCFNMYINNTNNKTQIGCLMNKECLILTDKYGSQKKTVQINAIISVFSLLLLIAIIITIYVILRKRRNTQQINFVAEDAQRTSMQGLMEQHTTDSE